MVRPHRSCAMLLAVALGVVVCAPRTSSAHPEWSPIRVNRYCKVVVTGGPRVRLVYTVLFGAGPAFPLRKGADANADGRVAPNERALLGERVGAWVKSGLHVTLDGVPTTLQQLATDVGLAGDAVAPEPFSVDLTYDLATGAAKDHRLVIDDRVEVPSEGDTEISIEAEQASALVAAHRGRATPGAAPIEEKLFTFRGPRFSALEDRSVTLVVRTGRDERSLPAHAPLWLGVALLAAAGLVLVGRRQRG